MKRTLTILTAAIFASALALPALAQDSTSSSVTTRESSRTETEQPAPSTVHTEREYKSERTKEMTAPVQPPSEVHIEKKVTTTTEVPPPAETTTATTTHRSTTSY